jgi:hypothetical protein
LGDTSTFTGHLARYTQSEHLIALRRMTGLNNGAFLNALDEATRRMDILESRMPDQNVFVGIQSIILPMIIE